MIYTLLKYKMISRFQRIVYPPLIFKSKYLGTILHDLQDNTWILGQAIGSGAFGDVYLACLGTSFVKEESSYVIKLEPHKNGPLFTEMHCLARIGKKKHRYNMFTNSHILSDILILTIGEYFMTIVESCGYMSGHIY